MNNINCLLHGATNCNSSNYGDYIYGDMIYSYFTSKNYNVQFYQPSNFFRKFLKNYDKQKSFNKKNSDLIVYIPGGYFGEGPHASFKENLVHFLRFMPLGIWASFHKKRMIVLGIGAGPLNSFLLRNSVRFICNHSLLVTTRDNISYKCLTSLSNNASIFESGDLILTYNVNYSKDGYKQISEIKNNAGKRKIFVIHFNHDFQALELFAETINSFSSNNNDFYYVVTSDSIMDNENDNISKFKKITSFDFYHFVYSDPYELSNLLDLSSVVLTCKLHVGVVASLLEKNVFVAACHYDKTYRFYKQIGYEDRCVDLRNIKSKELLNLIVSKINDSINIPDDEKNKANLTWIMLEKLLGEIKNEK